MTDANQDFAGHKLPPPLIFAIPLAGGLLLNKMAPRPWLPRSASRVLGGLLAVAGLGIGTSGFVTIRRAGSNPNPNAPVTAIVQAGPYRFTRNPMYIGFGLLYLGITCFTNALWPILLLPLSIVGIRRQVIGREEPYLARRFGQEYLAYKTRVRRWI